MMKLKDLNSEEREREVERYWKVTHLNARGRGGVSESFGRQGERDPGGSGDARRWLTGRRIYFTTLVYERHTINRRGIC